MTDWSSFINTQPSQRIDNEFVSDTSGIGVILVSGEDATDFLQNQFSHGDSLDSVISRYSLGSGYLFFRRARMHRVRCLEIR